MSEALVRESTAPHTEERVALVDADVHPAPKQKDIASRLSERWRSRFIDFGVRVANGVTSHPKVRNGGYRLDARPEDGGPPGSDLGLLRKQLLDEYTVDLGILIPLASIPYGGESPEYSAALSRALNDWISEEWLDAEPRLRSSLCVPFESPDLAVREIERRADDPRFVQVLSPSVAEAPLGDRKYWPIYAAAAEAGLPVAAHSGGVQRHTGNGHPAYYLEHHVWNGNGMQALALSFICEGVFDHFPTLQVVLVEGGMTWAAPFQWAMDSGWAALRNQSPTLGRAPSEYFRDHFWFTTQPVEESDNPRHMWESLRQSGMVDRIMFASDYPHWDFDSPALALPRVLPKNVRSAIMGPNACRLYGFAFPDRSPSS